MATRNLGSWERYDDLLTPIRERLTVSGLPWVIENVPGAPLIAPIMLCGSMFGLWLLGRTKYLRRHRLFESNVKLWVPGECDHRGAALTVIGAGGKGGPNRKGRGEMATAETARQLMGIPWISGRQLGESIPPAYTAHIGRILQAHLRGLTW